MNRILFVFLCVWLIIVLAQTCGLFFPPASSPVPGRRAAGHAAPGPSNVPSSARCCYPSPRLLLTCPMTSVRGSNLLQASPATVLPALVIRGKGEKVKRRGRKKRTHPKEKNCTTGSTRGSRSAQRVVGEVGIISNLYNLGKLRKRFVSFLYLLSLLALSSLWFCTQVTLMHRGTLS